MNFPIPTIQTHVMTLGIGQSLSKMRKTQTAQYCKLLLELNEHGVWDEFLTNDKINHSLSNDGMEICAKRQRRE